MADGLLILGLNGTGKTTLGRILAKRLAFMAMDAEDYYFPQAGDYTLSRPQEEAHQLMLTDVKNSNAFVISCVRCNLPEAIVRHVRLAVVLRTDAQTRMQRIEQRELDRFGSRVLPGGERHEAALRFRAFAAQRTDDTVTDSLQRLTCPVLELDASLLPETLASEVEKIWLTL